MVNIAELLKDCPQGMELDCPMYGGVTTFDCISEHKLYPITIKVLYGDIPCFHQLTKYGQLLNMPNTCCIIFPKGKTTWEGFIPPCKFKEGDDETKTLDKLAEPKFKLGDRVETFDNLYATVCACYFDKNKNCYMYDVTISHIDLGTYAENQLKLREYKIKPKFKMWDRVKSLYNNNQYDIIGITETHYTLEEVENKFKYVEPIIEDKNLELVPKKFDITTLKPLESKVLMRSSNAREWVGTIYSHYNKKFGNDIAVDPNV